MTPVVLAQSLPVADWQFWVVTAVVLAVVTIAIRRLLRTPAKKRATRVKLTITRDADEPGPPADP